MKKLAIFSVALLAASATAALALPDDATQQVQRQERSYNVKYTGGAVYPHIAVFTGSVRVQRYETGAPSTLDPFHPYDDRQCHWTITPHIWRQTFFVAPDGERGAKDDRVSAYSIPFSSGGSDFVLTRLASENCGQAQARFDSDVRNAVEAVNREFPGTMDRGLRELFEITRKKEKVVDVSQ